MYYVCMRVCTCVRIDGSFEPRPLPVQGEAAFSLRCQIWEIGGVTAAEERNKLQAPGNLVIKWVVAGGIGVCTCVLVRKLNHISFLPVVLSG